jgi:uncharacterized protein (TIGR02217 family)
VSNAIFPSLAGLGWEISRSTIFKNRRERNLAGIETAFLYAKYPLYRFTLNFPFLRDVASTPDYDTLLGFIQARTLGGDSFLFTDWSDNAVTDMQFGTGDGATTQFQLTRAFGAGGFAFTDPVQNVNAITNVKKAGVTQTNPANYTVDANGLVTFVTAPASLAALTWTGTFYYRCRFDGDTLDTTALFSGMWDAKTFAMIGAPGNRV